MGFMKMMENNEKRNTENGAVGYKTQGHKLVDLNFAVPSFRNAIDKDLFDESLAEDAVLTLKWLLYLRDIKQGIGERDSFREFFIHLCNTRGILAKLFIKTVPVEEFGRWDDYIVILPKLNSSEIKDLILNKISKQLDEDSFNYSKGNSISLLSKWMPSENTSSQKTRLLANLIRKHLRLSSKDYRKMLSKFRKYIDVVECKMSANNWENINYKAVPSKANLIYSDAFMKHDSLRRECYLESLKRGETKINANSMFLHDIVNKYIYDYTEIKKYDETLEQLWKAQNKVSGFKNTIVVRDGSGSMLCTVGNSGITALTVADAITLYCSENNSGEFKDKFITFSSNARIVNLSGKVSLHDKLVSIRKLVDCSNTNIYNVFNLILDTAIKNGVRNEDMPKTVLIISDMEFDATYHGYKSYNNKSLFEEIVVEYNDAGYDMPKLVFWNVNSRTNTIPIQQNSNGVILLSGFSKNLMSMVMSSELDPYKALVNELNKERYSVVDKIFE